MTLDRRQFLTEIRWCCNRRPVRSGTQQRPGCGRRADHTIRIAPLSLEIAPGHVIRTVGYMQEHQDFGFMTLVKYA